jgi:hypothetical protein
LVLEGAEVMKLLGQREQIVVVAGDGLGLVGQDVHGSPFVYCVVILVKGGEKEGAGDRTLWM